MQKHRKQSQPSLNYLITHQSSNPHIQPSSGMTLMGTVAYPQPSSKDAKSIQNCEQGDVWPAIGQQMKWLRQQLKVEQESEQSLQEKIIQLYECIQSKTISNIQIKKNNQVIMAQIQTYNSIIEQICAMANNRSNRSSIMNGAGNGSTSINSGDRERGSERNDWQADPQIYPCGQQKSKANQRQMSSIDQDSRIETDKCNSYTFNEQLAYNPQQSKINEDQSHIYQQQQAYSSQQGSQQYSSIYEHPHPHNLYLHSLRQQEQKQQCHNGYPIPQKKVYYNIHLGSNTSNRDRNAGARQQLHLQLSSNNVKDVTDVDTNVYKNVNKSRKYVYMDYSNRSASYEQPDQSTNRVNKADVNSASYLHVNTQHRGELIYNTNPYIGTQNRAQQSGKKSKSKSKSKYTQTKQLITYIHHTQISDSDESNHNHWDDHGENISRHRENNSKENNRYSQYKINSNTNRWVHSRSPSALTTPMHPYQSAMNTPLGNYQRNHLSNNSNVETVRYGGEATKKSSQNGNIRKNSVKQNKTNKNDREGYDDGYKVRTENKHRLYSARPSIDGCSNTQSLAMVPTNRNKTGTISKHTGIQVQINDKDPRIDQVTSPNKSFLKKLNQNSSMDNLVSYHQHNFNINNRTINHNKTDFNNNSNICIGNASNRYSNIDIEQLWNNVNISITQPDQNQVNNSNSKNKRKQASKRGYMQKYIDA